MAPQVDFYILSDERQQAYWQFCCRLLQKIVQQQHDVHVYCADPQHAQHLNTMLWTFHDTSFVPHCVLEDTITLSPMVYISATDEAPKTSDVLLNLGETVPAMFQQFTRILEIVSPQHREQGRAHYRHYQEHHCLLESHKINA